MKFNIAKKFKGSAIVYALGVISFVVVILFGSVQMIVSQVKNASETIAREKAFQIAESCAHEYRWYLAHNTDGRTIEEVMEFWENTSPVPRGVGGKYEWDLKNPEGATIGKCSAEIEDAPTTTTQPVIVLFEGWSADKTHIVKRLEIRFRRTSWSDYVVLSNEQAGFDANWDIKGKIMSNTGVRFDGVAHNRVYAGSTTYFDTVAAANKPGVWTSQAVQDPPNCEYNLLKGSCVFLGGKRYPIPQKDFNGIAVDLNAMKNSSQRPSGTTINNCSATTPNCYFNVPVGKAGKHITLKTNGTFDIITVKDIKSNSNDIKNEENGSKQTLNIPNDGIIFVGGNVWVDGVVDNKRVTIVAGEGEGDIYIGAGNLAYADKDIQEVIGLIAKGDILLTSEKKNCGTSCDNLEIDAAMVAKDGMVGKQDYNPSCCGVGCEQQKNRIDIYGSIVSNRFIEFTVSKDCNDNIERKVGFDTKNIEYDNNLYSNPPPYFPSDVYYTADRWREL